jgi:hypothetical protein
LFEAYAEIKSFKRSQALLWQNFQAEVPEEGSLQGVASSQIGPKGYNKAMALNLILFFVVCFCCNVNLLLVIIDFHSLRLSKKTYPNSS